MTGSGNKKNRQDKKIAKIAVCLNLANRIMAACLIVLAAIFVFNINNLSIKAFVLRDLRQDAALLNFDNEAAELLIMSLESYENVTARALEMNMVAVDNIEYLSAADTAVALK